MYISTLVSVAALLPFSFAQLNELAVAKGLKYFGSATDNSELTDTTYTSILSNTSQFGQITPGNSQKWDTIEPTQNTFSYTKGDVITSFAANNSQLVRCHNLCWYNQLPSWVTSGTWTNETLIAVLKNHIQNEVTHYKGQCYAWDVVNEAFNDDGTYRTDVFYNTIGPEYIPIAFETAALYDSDVKLYYNDYNIEYSGAKATAALNLVTSLKARGIKIDGVGLQAHFIVGSTPGLSAQTSNLQTFIDAGVEVAYTELDVRFSSLPPTDAGLVQQGTDYANTVSACLAVMPGCVGVTVWDFTDKYSWVPSTFSGAGDACLWYDDYTLHPAYYSVIAALGGSATATSSATTASATTLSTVVSKAQSTSSSTSVLASTTAAVSSSNVATSTSAAATATSTGTGVAKWGQCGGTGYTGSTSCVSGTTCTYSNDYYSQCL